MHTTLTVLYGTVGVLIIQIKVWLALRSVEHYTTLLQCTAGAGAAGVAASAAAAAAAVVVVVAVVSAITSKYSF